jgi:galactokinase
VSLEEIAARIRTQFRAEHGRAPEWLAAAPGRVNVIGEHTDYNGGFVLPMAIERYTVIAAAPNDSPIVNLRSTMTGDAVRVDLSQPLSPGARGHWGNYPKGVLAGFMDLGIVPPGFDALIHSSVPAGGGLSSSAALEVATATLLEGISGRRLDPIKKALLCQQAEHRYAGIPCGIMDQFISTLGRKDHLLLLDCRSNEPSWVPLTDPSVAILIVNTNVKHELATSAYGERRRKCEEAARALGVPSLREATSDLLQQRASAMDEMSVRCARHVIGEIARTLQAAQRIREADWNEAGRLMYASHESLRIDYAVSCPELDAVVESAQDMGPQGGVFGCRMTGGGFGGCAVALIQTGQQEAIANEIAARYRRRTGIAATLFASRPAQGACLIES